MNLAFSGAALKETAISARTNKTSPALTDELLITDGALKKATLQALATLLTANPDAKVITDRTEETTLASDDMLLVYDLSATALRKSPITSIVNAAVVLLALPDGSVLQTIQKTLTAQTSVTVTMPSDNTIPQNSDSEGTQILTQAITPKSATNKILCRVVVPFASNSATRAGVALFRAGSTDAICSTETQSLNSGTIAFEFLDSPASASAQTYSVRVGSFDGSLVGVCGQASSAGTRLHGGSNMATLTLQEIKAS